MPDVPDLAALREKAEKATPGPWWQNTTDHFLVFAETDTLASTRYSRDAEYVAAASPDVLLAVLARLDEQQKEIERLREALDEYGGHQDRCAVRSVFGPYPCDCGWPETVAALAGSPAEKEEPS